MTRLPRVLALAVFLLGGLATAAPPATSWTLKPATGDKTKGWAAQSWSWDAGNPLADQGATWTLATQAMKDPTPTSAYTPMIAGEYVDFIHIWQGDKEKSRDPQVQYRETTLSARPADATPQHSQSAVLLFKAPADGNYQVTVAGHVTVQNPTAGHGKVSLYTLTADRATATKVQEQDVNAAVAGAFGSKLPDKVAWVQTVALKQGQEIALAVQAVNPGPASVGTVALQLAQLTVEKAP